MPIVARSVYQAISETVLVREIGDRIVELEPDVTPLIVMTTKARRKSATTSPRIEQIEDELRVLWGQVSLAADTASNIYTFTVVTGQGVRFAVGDLIAAIKTDDSEEAEEIMRVTGGTSDTLYVTRNVGGGADTLEASNALRIIGSAYAENAAYGTPRSTDKTTIISYAQIFRTPVQVSNTIRASKLYGQNDEDYQLAQALKEHKKEIEAAALWGRASESLAAPGSIWTSMGFKSRVSTNVTDFSVTATLAKFNNFSETAFRYGSPTKVLIAAPIVVSAINWFSQAKLMTATRDTVFGVQISRLLLPHGEFLLARNWQMQDAIADEHGYDDELYAVDLDAVEYRFLSANGVSRDTALYRDVLKTGVDGKAHEYLTQAGWLIGQEKRHARGFGVSSYA